MNVLLVDDDRFVIAALMKGIHWKELGFDQVFTAYNITEARTIIEQNTIDLLLSDIDMPNGSGLDLLSWIRENKNEMQAIFLTNYADFYYAQKAISLKSFHYFLKPIDLDKLTAIIREFTAQFEQQNNLQVKNCESFWHSFLHDEMPGSSELLESYFTQYNLPYEKTDLFLPVMFDLFPYTLSSGNELRSCFTAPSEQNAYMKSTFEAVFIDQISIGDVFIEYNENSARYLAIFKLHTPEISPLFSMNCERFIETVTSQIHCTLNCFIGIPSQPDSFRQNMKNLRIMISNSLDCNGKVLLQSYYQPTIDIYPPCDVDALEIYLQTGQYAAFLNSCHQYLHRLSCCGNLHSVSINSFYIDVVQVLYSFLKDRGILANKLFHDETYHFLSRNAKNSVYDMHLYLQYITYLTEDYLSKTSSDQSIAKSMQEYVDRHYAEDISRNTLTDIFYLDPDYASKLFKKETGLSFKNYIINKRIDIAKNLLTTTDLLINTVADNVGYGNYSYFTRLFKKVTDMTPAEYRNIHHL